MYNLKLVVDICT